MRHLNFIPIILSSFYVSFAGPSISGNMGTITFSSNSNPYFVEKDLIIPPGKTVTIPKGCILLFNPFAGLEVHGTLIVQGTQDTPVVFSSVSDTIYNKKAMRPPAPFDWNGINVHKESHGAQLNYFVLGYSVYGLKAQNADLSVNSGIFRSNGQFHFTINETIKDIKDNIPFSFDHNAIGQFSQPASATNAAAVSSNNHGLTTRAIIKSDPFRYSSLGIGVLGAGLGVYFAVKANQRQSVLQQISSGEAPPDKNRWNNEHNAKWSYITGSSVSFIFGLLGAAGFGVSLAF